MIFNFLIKKKLGTVIVASLVGVWASRDTTISRTICRAVSEQFFCGFWLDRFVLRGDHLAGIFRHRIVGGDPQHPSPGHAGQGRPQPRQEDCIRRPRQNALHPTWYPRRLSNLLQNQGIFKPEESTIAGRACRRIPSII